MQVIPVTVSRYDTLAPLSLTEFLQAREAWESGDVNGARAGFEHLFQRLPDSVIVGVWLQEADLEASIAALADEPRARAALAATWARQARDAPTVPNLVLAARVAATSEAASLLLDQAEALDPECAWVQYARAHLAAQAADWPLARARVARAKAADPGHLWTYRLEAWMKTRTGSVAEAAAALRAFVERASEDPRMQPDLLAESQLDLAIVLTLMDEAQEARDLLERIDVRRVDPARRLLALAGIEQALDELRPALAAAEAAETVAPGRVLPVLQQALLYDEWLGDPVKAEEAWRRVLAIARSSPDLTSVLERTRAGVRLERFELQRGAGRP